MPTSLTQAQVSSTSSFGRTFPQVPQAQMPQFLAQTMQNPYSLGVPMVTLPQNWNNAAVSQATALAQNKPIGSTDDAEVIVRAIRTSWSEGKTTREALEGLHGTNNHPASSWKDYYLEHDRAIVTRISALDSDIQSNSSSIVQAAASSPKHAAQSSKLRTEHRNASRLLPTPPTSHSPSRVHSTTSNRVDEVPKYPSRASSIDQSPYSWRCPTPPSHDSREVLPGGRYAFTEADKEFYFKYTEWMVKQDPNVTRKAVARGLADKAPHHSQESWKSYYRHHRKAVDRIFDRAAGRSTQDASSDGSDEDSASDEGSQDESSSENEGDSSAPEHFPDTDVDTRNMGDTGGQYTPADFRIVARFIVKKRDWENMTNVERQKSLHKKYPQRTTTAWGHCLQRYERTIWKLAHKYRQRTRRASIAEHPAGLSSLKRRLESETTNHAGDSATKRREVEHDGGDIEGSSGLSAL